MDIEKLELCLSDFIEWMHDVEFDVLPWSQSQGHKSGM